MGGKKLAKSFRTIELSDTAYESQGLRYLTVKTDHLKGRGDICLYIPTVSAELTDLPIYVLLHGVYGSAWIWALKGGAHHTAERLMSQGEIQPAIIAMPSDGLWGDGSAYLDHEERHYAQWIVSDVITAIREHIPQAETQTQVCIGGLSMGGYGALRLGALYPEVYSAISGHSSITCLTQMSEFVEEPIDYYLRQSTQPDVIDIMRAHRDRLPAIRFDCGVSDTLIEANRLLHQQLTQADIPHVYEEHPGGHEWPYWQQHVEQTFRFFDQQTRRT